MPHMLKGGAMTSLLRPTRRELLAYGSATAAASATASPLLARAAPPLQFMVLGDWGRDGAFYQRQVAAAMGEFGRSSFVVTTGDNFYQRGVGSVRDNKWDRSFERIYTNVPQRWYATLGNHDYGPGWAHPEIADRLVRTVSDLGITVLRNQSAVVEGLQIVGLDDFWAHRFNPAAAFAASSPALPTIVLSHNPDTVDLPVWAGFDGWILAGHTHGGQCKPPFLPPPMLPVQNTLYTSGEFELSGRRRLYINRGVGHWYRVRFNARPEITLHELQPESV